MPTIVKLGHVAIRMFANDHNPPHFHIVTMQYQVSVFLSDLSIMAGRMDRKSLSVALEWAAQNREVLENEWTRLNPER